MNEQTNKYTLDKAERWTDRQSDKQNGFGLGLLGMEY